MSDGGIHTGDVKGTGIAIGPHAQATVTTGTTAAELAELLRAAHATIARRPDDPAVDKTELADTVERIQAEAAKGPEANESRIRRWLTLLKDVAPDVLEVTAAALLNPVAGVADAVRKVAAAIREQDG